MINEAQHPNRELGLRFGQSCHDDFAIPPSNHQDSRDRGETVVYRPRSKAIIAVAAIGMLCGAGGVSAQREKPIVDPTTFAFEVVSIHPDPPDSMSGSASVMSEPSRYEANHVTVKELVREAYAVDDLQIAGDPGWMDSASFSVDASIDDATRKALDTLNDEQRAAAQRHMLQAVLADRFHLALVLERKDRPVYLLTVAKEGARLQEANPNDTYEIGARDAGGGTAGSHSIGYEFIAGAIKMPAQGATMDQLVDRLNQKLSGKLGRLFVNDTGLPGKYDFELDLHVPWVNKYGAMLESTPSDDSPEFSLSPALQRLGLNLKPTKAPVPVLTITHIDQPSEN